MAPNPQSSQKLPRVVPNGTGWRVEVYIDGRTRTGPFRSELLQAENDATRARAATSRVHMASIIKELKDETAERKRERDVAATLSSVDPNGLCNTSRQNASSKCLRQKSPAAAVPGIRIAIENSSSGVAQSAAAGLPLDGSPLVDPGSPSGTVAAPGPPGDQSMPATSKATTLCLRGLNIQWPFSQLILMGEKTEEVREYDLGHRKICTESEETWIVEARGLHAHATTDAICDGLEVAPRPRAAQIVGTVTFDSASKYDGTRAFRSARDRHRIADGSKFDWDGKGARYGWRVGTARALRNPVPVGSTGMTGFGARSFEVTFASSMAL